MLIRHFQVAIVLAFACLLTGHVQAVPDKVERLKAVLPLDDAQKAMIKEYAGYWVQKL